MKKTLILLDWDDTLFPTSWVVSNKINFMNSSDKTKYSHMFTKLDSVVSTLLTKLKKCGIVMVVTNAMGIWITQSLQVMPRTAKVMKKINIISARELYNEQSGDKWKTFTFIDIFNKLTETRNITNIISIGDAEYEYKALVNLYIESGSQPILFKTIKLADNPTYNILLEELNILTNIGTKICSHNSHIDWVIQPTKPKN